jgi:hypothetical protein
MPSIDAVLCTDAIQFPDEPASAYEEIRGGLTPCGPGDAACWDRWTATMSGSVPAYAGKPRRRPAPGRLPAAGRNATSPPDPLLGFLKDL